VLTIHDDTLVYGEGETCEEASKDHDAKFSVDLTSQMLVFEKGSSFQSCN